LFIKKKLLAVLRADSRDLYVSVFEFSFPCFSVADLGCLSLIPDPDVYPSRIPDPKTATKERVKKICCHTFFCSHKFHITEIYFIFEMLKKEIWANFQRIIELFTQKIVTKLPKYMGLGSGIRKKPIPDPGFRIQGSKRRRIPDPDPHNCHVWSRIFHRQLYFLNLIFLLFVRCCYIGVDSATIAL
jgi:hypothetical protein